MDIQLKNSNCNHLVDSIFGHTVRNEDKKFLIYIPHDKREKIVEWYHEMLHHPGAKKMKLMMKQHFNWPGMSKKIETYCKNCEECKKFKNYGTEEIREDTTTTKLGRCFTMGDSARGLSWPLGYKISNNKRR